MRSRERVLRTIDLEPADHLPFCFLLFSALRGRTDGERDFIRRQLDLGLDAVVSLPGLGHRLHPEVTTEVALDDSNDPPLLRKVYHTPAGDLDCVVRKAHDWPHGDDIPLFTDFVIPRGRKFLVNTLDDLEALSYLFADPSDDDIRIFGEQSAVLRSFADEHGLATRAGFHRLGDTVCWLCGQTEFATMAYTDPDLFSGVLDLIHGWHRRQAEIILEQAPDIWVQAEWYAAPFLSPDIYRQYMAPRFADTFGLAREAGSRVCYIGTADIMPFLDELKSLDIDVLFGPDPLSGSWDMSEAKRRTADSSAVWGGVNGYLQVTEASEEKARQAVRDAIEVLAPGGGFLLAPVDDVRIEPSHPDPGRAWDRICRNVVAMRDEWRTLCE